MKIIAERVIAYLKGQSSVTDSLGDTNSIFVMFTPVKKDKYIVVSSEPGADGNALPINSGELSIQICMNSSSANAPTNCLNLSKTVDDLLNKQEHNITTEDYQIINLIRTGGSGLRFDNDTKEYWFELSYSYILSEAA